MRRIEPELLLSVLAVLPICLASLKLDVSCAGPLFFALARFPRADAHVTGDGSRVSWSVRESGWQSGQLRELHLAPDGRQVGVG